MIGATGKAILIALCVLLGAVASANEEPGRAPDPVLFSEPAKELGDFELTDQNGKPVRFNALRGRPAFVFFGFTRCPDVCPTALHKLRLLIESHGRELQRPRVIMISVDAAHDSPAMMKSFLASHSAEFIGLTGDRQRLRDVATQFSAAAFQAATKDAAGRYLVDHSAQIYLVDPSGRLRATFFNASVEAMNRVSRRLLGAEERPL